MEFSGPTQDKEQKDVRTCASVGHVYGAQPGCAYRVFCSLTLVIGREPSPKHNQRLASTQHI